LASTILKKYKQQSSCYKIKIDWKMKRVFAAYSMKRELQIPWVFNNCFCGELNLKLEFG